MSTLGLVFNDWKRLLEMYTQTPTALRQKGIQHVLNHNHKPPEHSCSICNQQIFVTVLLKLFGKLLVHNISFDESTTYTLHDFLN